MTEKLSINLTEGDVTVRQKENDDPRVEPVITYFSQCPICGQTIDLTRAKGACCKCDIEWRVEVKIKGTRALDDDDKFQMPIPWKAAEFKKEPDAVEDDNMSVSELTEAAHERKSTVGVLPINPTPKPETTQNEATE